MPFLIAGLGNPGPDYVMTRHNVGFLMIDALIHALNAESIGLKHHGELFKARVNAESVYLLKPMTFMNLSGQSIRSVMSYYDIPMANLLVIYDDFDLDLGTVRLRSQGSAGTHNGMKSIIEQLQGVEFNRLRVGIGPKDNRLSTTDFVLGRFSEAEQVLLRDMEPIVVNIVQCFIEKGVVVAMREPNRLLSEDTDSAKG